MAFNLSKMKIAVKEWVPIPDDKVDKTHLQENQYHNTLMKTPGREAAASQLALMYTAQAFMGDAEHPESIHLKDMMNEYFSYLKTYDREFLKSIKNLMYDSKRGLIPLLKKDPEARDRFVKQQIPPVALPGMQNLQPQMDPMAGGAATPATPGAPAPMPAGGAPMGMPMASSSKTIKTAGHTVHLVRKNGNYLLRDSLIGKILRGAQQYVGEDGINRVMSINDDVAVPRTSAAARLALDAEEQLPDAIFSAIQEASKENGLEGDDLPRSIVGPYLENGSFDLRPLSVRIGGAPLGIMLYNNVDGIKEPKQAHNMRLAMGKAMSVIIHKLKAALEMKGVKVGERKLRMPPYFNSMTEDDVVQDKYPTRSPDILSNATGSMDLRSLAMTATSQQAGKHQKMAALDRIMDIMTSNPDLYRTRPLSKDDISIMRSMSGCQAWSFDPVCDRMSKLADMAELFDAADAVLLEKYSEADDDLRERLAKMMVSQKRNDAVMANPDIAMTARCASCLNPADDQSAKVIKEMIRGHVSGGYRLNNPSIKRGMRSLYENGDEEMLNLSLQTDTPLRDLALSILFEKGGPDDWARGRECLSQSCKCSTKSVGPLLVTSAILRGTNFAPDFMDLISSLGGTPEGLAPFVGRDGARNVMRLSRLGWDGTALPSPADIHSLTDDPLPLIKNYYEIAKGEDPNARAALHRLYHLISQQMGQGDDPYLGYSHNYLREALIDLGEDGEMLGALIPKTMHPKTQLATAKMLPDGSIMTKRAGVYCIDGTDIRFSSAPSDAVRIAIAKLVSARE